MRLLFTILFIGTITCVNAQSKTTEELHKNNSNARSLFFYQNTLRMLNQQNDKNYDALIKDIEKMKLLMVEKDKFGTSEYKKLVAGYKSEKFEEIMTSRYEGKNFDVFLKEEKGKTKGMIVTVNDSTTIYVLDIVGSIALDKIHSFFSEVNSSSEVGKILTDFMKK